MLQLLRDINLYEILYAGVGAFLGFFLAYLAEKKLDKHKKRQTIENIVAELLNIKSIIEKRVVQNASTDLITKVKSGAVIESLGETDIIVMRSLHGLRYSICTPIWDTIVSSGILLEFKDERYFDELIQTYSRIHRIVSIINNEDLNPSLYVGIIRDGIYIDDMISGKGSNSLANEIEKRNK